MLNSINCLVCNKKCKKNAVKYCSLKCLANYKWQETVKEIEKNNGFAPKDSYGRVRVMRRYLLQTRGTGCACCGLTIWQNHPIPLIMDHIDGNALNNTLSNLRLICCNCDGLSSTYKGRNRGKGRSYRRDRYLKIIDVNKKEGNNGK